MFLFIQNKFCRVFGFINTVYFVFNFSADEACTTVLNAAKDLQVTVAQRQQISAQIQQVYVASVSLKIFS